MVDFAKAMDRIFQSGTDPIVWSLGLYVYGTDPWSGLVGVEPDYEGYERQVVTFTQAAGTMGNVVETVGSSSFNVPTITIIGVFLVDGDDNVCAVYPFTDVLPTTEGDRVDIPSGTFTVSMEILLSGVPVGAP